MSAMPKVDVNGRIPIPVEVQDAADIHAGDGITFHVIGPGHFEVLKQPVQGGERGAEAPRHPAEQAESHEPRDWRSVALEPLSLDEIIARYRVDEPYDDAAIREEWQAEAADELIDRINRGIE